MKARKILVAPSVAGLLVLSACGGGGGDTGERGASTTESIAPISSQDINIKDRGELAQGGTIRLDVAGLRQQLEPVQRRRQQQRPDPAPARRCCRRSSTTTPRATPTPNPNFVVSAEETNASPTTVNYKLNPKAVWGDGSPVDADDMIATWKANNGEQKDFNVASTQGFDQIASITTGADKFDVTVTYKAAYPDWTQPFSVPGVAKAESVKDADDLQHRLEEAEQRLAVRAVQGGELRQQPEGADRGPQRQVVGREAAAGQDHLPGHLAGRDGGRLRQQRAGLLRHRSRSRRLPAGQGRLRRRDPAGRRAELPALHLQHQGRRADRPEGAPGHRQGPRPRGHRRLRPGRHRLARAAAEQQHPAAEPGGLRGRRRARPGSTTTSRAPRPIWTRWAGPPAPTASARRTARSSR